MRANQLIFGGKILLVFLDWILLFFSEVKNHDFIGRFWFFLTLSPARAEPMWIAETILTLSESMRKILAQADIYAYLGIIKFDFQ